MLNVQHRGSHRKIFSSGFPLRSLSSHAPTANSLFMSFYSPFPLERFHPRAIYEPGERHAPTRFIPRSSGHDTTLHTEFLDHHPSIRRGLGILMILLEILLEKTSNLERKLANLARNTCTMISRSNLYIWIYRNVAGLLLSMYTLKRCWFAFIDVLFKKHFVNKTVIFVTISIHVIDYILYLAGRCKLEFC